MNIKFDHIILGGTFDHFHVGHEAFIKKACQMGKRLSIGITTESMYKDKPLSEIIENYATREVNVRNYVLSLEVRNSDFSLIPISDIYGSSLTDISIDAIVVTPDTKKGAVLINKKREEIGMKPLSIILVPFVKDDMGGIISSVRIRYGDIDRRGVCYLKSIISNKVLYLPEMLRDQMREPFGRIIRGSFENQTTTVLKIAQVIEAQKPPMVYAIGDIIAGSLVRSNITPSVIVIDLKSRREALKVNSKFEVRNSKLRKYRNKAGTIDSQAVARLCKLRDQYLLRHKPLRMIVEGEEDLLALAAILLAPLHSIILYGQYNLGVILVTVTEEKKNEIYKIVSKFEVK